MTLGRAFLKKDISPTMLEGWEFAKRKSPRSGLMKLLPMGPSGLEGVYKLLVSVGLMSMALGAWSMNVMRLSGFTWIHGVIMIIASTALFSSLGAWIFLVRSLLRDSKKLRDLMERPSTKSFRELYDEASRNLTQIAVSIERARQKKKYEEIDKLRNMLREQYDTLKTFGLASGGYGRYYEMAEAYLEEEAAAR